VSAEWHALAALSVVEEDSVLTGWEIDWVPQPVSMLQ
jgi:hypothetical protein